MIFSDNIPEPSALNKGIMEAYRQDEAEAVKNLLSHIQLSEQQKANIQQVAYKLVETMRQQRLKKSGLDSFLDQYDLSSEEGIALMCLAEALLRVPDKETVDKLITDKISTANWQAHLGKSHSLFVNAATWGLMLTGKIYQNNQSQITHFAKAFKGLMKRGGEPFIRKTIHQAMKILGKQFVMGENMNEALKRAKEYEKKGYTYSYDMLGEEAVTQKAADIYFEAYQNAIKSIATAAKSNDPKKNPGISVKLSALHPRYQYEQKFRAVPEVASRLKKLAVLAKESNINLTVDAEESERLDLSLEIIEKVFSSAELEGWDGFGLALQAYQKRAWYVIDWLVDLAKKNNRRMMVRLIKGAYWDSEVKKAQEFGLEGYPVFTRKMNTDVSYLACAQKILEYPEQIYPMFATHNANTVASVLEMTKNKTDDFEFQCLHGMGQSMYDHIVGAENMNHPCRIYAPVGTHEDLLPYLVRRLLENGANTSFVNRIADESQPIDEVIQSPLSACQKLHSFAHPSIPKPVNLYKDRLNSTGFDLSDPLKLKALQESLSKFESKSWYCEPTTLSKKDDANIHDVTNPMNHTLKVGTIYEATEADIKKSLDVAQENAFEWDITPVEVRAGLLEKTAELFEKHMVELMALAVREAGKTFPDAIAEVREAVDFCRYYAVQARKNFSKPIALPGPTGEYNQIEYRGRGPIVCISPWNFPLAIFTGQVVAALVAGNPVIAKPANQTSLIAARAVELMHEAGIPKTVLQLLPSKGSAVGKYLMTDHRVKGVVFTGSTETAQRIGKTLIERGGELVPLVAETGGQNAMIVDSSSLPEQVVKDVIQSAFNSAGQRCSALRVLYVQDEVADKIMNMLKGAMEELNIDDPGFLFTDVGPAIDFDSRKTLQDHIEKMEQEARLIFKLKVPSHLRHGSYISPAAFEIKSISQLEREVFGPILHVIRYKTANLNQVIEDINQTRYGLTLGIHSRVAATASYIQQRVRVGNCYVNRNMVGAVVGVQPFGGEGLSGTGPKAGGPLYLYRLVTERTLSINTAAAGGNASLMCLKDDADIQNV